MSNQLTLLPDYIGIIQKPSVEFYKNSTSLFDIFLSYLGELDTLINFSKQSSSSDIKQGISDIYKLLNDNDFKVTYNSVEYEFDNIFKLYVIEKFNSLVDNYKEFIKNEIGSENIYFVNYSDDIGDVLNERSVVDNSTSPYFDKFNDSFNYSSYLGCSLYNKVSQNELLISMNLGLLTDGILKRSTKDLQSDYVDNNTAKLAHGENLVTDVLYIDRLFSFKESGKSQIKLQLKNMYDFVQFFKSVNFKDQDLERNALNFSYTSQIENIERKINILSREVS